MNTATSRPPPAAHETPWSLAQYRMFNDALEAKHRSRVERLHAETREHLRRASRRGAP